MAKVIHIHLTHGIESRKGNIDIHSMPTKYLDIYGAQNETYIED